MVYILPPLSDVIQSVSEPLHFDENLNGTAVLYDGNTNRPTSNVLDYRLHQEESKNEYNNIEFILNPNTLVDTLEIYWSNYDESKDADDPLILANIGIVVYVSDDTNLTGTLTTDFDSNTTPIYTSTSYTTIQNFEPDQISGILQLYPNGISYIRIVSKNDVLGEDPIIWEVTINGISNT